MIKLVIFDLDGTITCPHLDFRKIREDMGIAGDASILDYLDSLKGEDREKAHVILDGHEKDAACNSRLSPGIRELLSFLREKQIRTGIITRNTRENVLIVLEKHGLVVDDIITRDDGCVKPSPDGVFAMCGKFGARPEETIFIGDFLFDIQTGKNAGTQTVLLKRQDNSDWPVKADYEVDTLDEVAAIIRELSGG